MLILCLIGLQSVLAQSREVSGIVTSADDGLSIPGVSVIIKGTTIGTTTDFDGKYTIATEEGQTLVFSFVGMKTTELPANTDVINLVMRSESIGMDEVMVVAYGTTKKSSFTGAASSVGSDELTKSASSDVIQSMQGKIAGVSVVSTTGKTGETAKIRIRGVGSYGADSDPLYVIDGIPGAPMPNSEDIASMTILKDAAASSLYGSRAANGVVVITTKQGKKGETKFSVQYKKGISQLTTGEFETLGAADFYAKSWEGLYNKARYVDEKDVASSAAYANTELRGAVGFNPYNLDNPYDDKGKLKDNAQLMYDEDWQDALFRTGETDAFDFSASGGSEKISFYFSGSYYNEKGISIEDDYKRYTAKVNVSSQINERLKIGVNTTMKHSESKDLGDSASENNGFYNMNTFSAITPIFQLDDNFKPVVDANGNKVYNYKNKIANDYNPIGLYHANARGTKANYIFFSPYADVKLAKDLMFNTKMAVRYGNGSEFSFNNPFHGAGPSDGGNSYKESWESQRITTSNYLTYNKSFGDHGLNFMLGSEYESYEYHELAARGTGYPLNKASIELSIAQKPAMIYSRTLEDALISYFAQVKYDYKDKYYSSFSYRRDGSSKFGSANRWGNFWSVGGSWRINQESFMEDLSFVDDLKLRASYGINGTEAIDRYKYDDLYSMGSNYNDQSGLTHTQLPNPELGWEENATFNIGVDFAFLSKYKATLEYYNKQTSDLLMQQPISGTTGFTEKTVNIGAIENKGFEFSFDAELMSTQDFRWDASFNISYNQNEWTELPQDEIIDGSKRYAVGKGRYNFYLKEWAGVDKTNGNPLWYMNEKDADGNLTGEKVTTSSYTAASYYDFGDATPNVFVNLSNSFSYKGFDLSFQIYGAFGGQIYDDLTATTMHGGSKPGRQLNQKVMNSWSESNTNTDVPMYIYNTKNNAEKMSSRFLSSSDFVRLKSVNLAYTVDNDKTKKYGVSNLKFYFLGENLFTVTNFEGYDPEVALTGRVGYTLPNLKKFTFGVKLDF